MSMDHPMERTTPRARAEIHESQATLAEVAQTYNIVSVPPTHLETWSITRQSWGFPRSPMVMTSKKFDREHMQRCLDVLDALARA